MSIIPFGFAPLNCFYCGDVSVTLLNHIDFSNHIPVDVYRHVYVQCNYNYQLIMNIYIRNCYRLQIKL